MYAFVTDHKKDSNDPRVLLHRGYHAHGLPRLIPLCRLLGHKPVVDGYDSEYGRTEERRARWVACDRCGVRPEPQGGLDPDQWQLGQPYTGPSTGRLLPPEKVRQLQQNGTITAYPWPKEPGGWPTNPTGDLGAELIVGRALTTGVGIKVGNQGSENTLAAHIGLGPIGALYVHTENFGQWLQRRLNPVGYESREIDVAFHNGRVWWKVWARRDEHRASDPKWMSGDAVIDPRHYLFGPVTNRKVGETDRVPAVVRMPEGDQHDVLVHLEQWESRRTRGRARTYWMAQWDCKKGIPVRNHSWKGDETFSCTWMTEGVTPDNPRWPLILAATAAEQCSRDRARYGYRAPAPAEAAEAAQE